MQATQVILAMQAIRAEVLISQATRVPMLQTLLTRAATKQATLQIVLQNAASKEPISFRN